jgi:quercetin dioxygenase-like cupin family protein
MRVPFALYVVVLCVCVTRIASAQDAVKVDPNHYSVVSENNEVRILKIHYGPHEKSVMHSHPDSVVVFLTDGKVQFTGPDGKKTDADFKPGQSQFTPAQVHLPENTGDQPMDGILVELKGKSTKTKPAAK